MSEFTIDASDVSFGVFVLDGEGTIRRANGAFAQMLGHQDPSELRGRPLRALLSNEEMMRAWVLTPSTVEISVGVGGALRRFELSGKKLADGVQGHLRDLTGHQELDERYHLIVESAPFRLVIIQDDIVVYSNRLQEQQTPSLGRKASEIVFESMHPDDREMVANRIRARAVGDVVPNNYRFRQLIDGAERWAEVWSYRVEYQGRPAIQALTLDVHERVTAERELTALDKKYQHAQKLEAIGRLAGGVAHDFNNLLTVILSCADLSLRETALPDDTRAELAQIRDAALQAGELTKQLLAFSRADPGETRRVELGQVVKSLQRMLRRLVGENIEIRSDLAQGPLWVVANEGQLEQIIANLTVNASDAMPLGGTLELHTVALEDPETGSLVRLSVRDSGTGIPEDVLPMVFEPFFTTKEIGKGTGLGLSTVLGIAEQWGGAVEIETPPEGGTVVHVVLPMAPAPEDAREKSAAEPARPKGAGRVLVVEDEPLVRTVAERILSTAGYDVTTAIHPLDALNIMERQTTPFDLVLSDVVMPHMSGFDLVQQLSQSHPGLPVVLMTGYADEDAIPMGYEIGEQIILRKPFNAKELLRTIQLALSQEQSLATSPH